MLKLATGAEPFWRAILPGIEFQFAPIGIKAVRAARRAAAASFGADPDDLEEAADSLSREMLRRGIVGWRGEIGDQDGNPLPFAPEALEAVLRDPVAYEAASKAYLADWERAETEKNGFGVSSSGTGAEATPASGTASRSAAAAPKAGASRTPKPAKTAARTSSTSSRATKQKPSSR